MKRILAAGLALLLLAGPVSAGKQRYTLALDQAQPVASGSYVTFTATRTALRQTHIEWLALDCYDGPVEVSETEVPILWGTSSSKTGTTQPLPVSGNWCEAALVTTIDYDTQKGDPEVYIRVR